MGRAQGRECEAGGGGGGGGSSGVCVGEVWDVYVS